MDDTLGRAVHSETDETWKLSRRDGELRAEPDPSKPPESSFVDHPEDLPATPLAGLWRHYKGATYTVLAEALAPDGQRLVLYSSADERLWLRPREMWQERVEVGSYSGQRFSRLGEP